jgi:hypothetical protein
MNYALCIFLQGSKPLVVHCALKNNKHGKKT